MEIHRLIDQNQKQLSLEEELTAYEKQDFDSLICSQLALIYRIAANVVKEIHHIELLEDAFSTGLLRLVELVRIYDPSKARLSTLCHIAIEQRIRVQISRMADIGGIRRAATTKGGKFIATGKSCVYDTPLDMCYSEEYKEAPNIQRLVSEAHLSSEETKMIDLRLKGMTLVEIANSFGYHKSKVRRIIANALHCLRKTEYAKNI